MARGQIPKPPGQRARRNKDPIPWRVIEAEPVVQPPLPTVEIAEDGEMREWVWPAQTVEWWRMWRDSPLSASFTANDWSELLDTALLHARYWRGDFRLAVEIRQRVANFGATPADRARLRITFAQANEAESRQPAKRTANYDSLKMDTG